MKRSGEILRMVPLKHTSAGRPPTGWLPMWSAKKERQGRKRVRLADLREQEYRNRNIPPVTVLPAPRVPFWKRIADRVRRFIGTVRKGR